MSTRNVMNATKIWWDPLIPECIEFKNGLAVHEIESDIEISIISQQPKPVSMRDEFMKLYPKKSLGQLHQLAEVIAAS
ncbi:hypothetical protein SESBI_10293 [Sesbania bispinosa]|nr:hypothetical protein SESBI_10293 [Sesbania bispinosa]